MEFAFGGVGGTLNKLKLLRGSRLLKAAEVLFCKENPLKVQAM